MKWIDKSSLSPKNRVYFYKNELKSLDKLVPIDSNLFKITKISFFKK